MTAGDEWRDGRGFDDSWWTALVLSAWNDVPERVWFI